LSGVGSIDEVDDISISDTKGDIGYGEGTIAGVEVANDGESTVENRGVGVRDGNIDWVGVTRVERPVDNILTTLHPVIAGAWAGDRDCQRTETNSRTGCSELGSS